MVEGLEKVVAVIEDRFGRRPTTGLLFLVALAIASYCIYIVFSYLVLPVYGFLSKYIQGPEITVATVFYTTAFIAAVIVLFPLAYVFLSRKKVPQAALARLAELRNEGIDTVYAVHVTNDQQFQEWKRTKQEWEQKLRGYIEKNFPKSDYLFASHLGAVKEHVIGRFFNGEHLNEINFVIRQLEIVEQILNSYRG